MFEHDSSVESFPQFQDASHSALGGIDGEYTPDGLDGYSPQELAYVEQLEESLTPQEISELDQQEATMASLPPDEAEQYQQETVSAENASAEESMDESMQSAENFDQILNDD